MRVIAAVAAAVIAASGASAQLNPPVVSERPGLVRVWGNAQMEPVVRGLAEAFRARHPRIRIETNFGGSDVAMAGLWTDKADIALIGREARPSEKQAFEWIYRYPLSAVEVMTGSASAAGKSPALAVLVHRANPLRSISLEQLAAVFGVDGAAIATWGGLGLSGEWATRPIRLYSPFSESGTGSLFRHLVTGGSNKMPWDRLHEFHEPVVKGRHVDGFGRDIADALAKDPWGLAIGNLGDAGTAVKALPIAARGEQAVALTARTVRERRYPFSRRVYAYLNREKDKPIDPDEAAFLAFLLSLEGQRIVERNGFLARCPTADDPMAEVKSQPYVAKPAPAELPSPCARTIGS